MTKNFKDMTPAQVERLAIKNREKSRNEMLDEELDKRGIKKSKTKNQVYVDRSIDPSIEKSDHSTIFREMKKKPYQD